MSDLERMLSSAAAEMSRLVAEATEQLVATYWMETGAASMTIVSAGRGGKTWVTVEPGGARTHLPPVEHIANRVAEYMRRTDLPASGAAVVYGFDGLTFAVNFQPRPTA